MPQLSGSVKCIFIDPPYNTGNDVEEGVGWTYSDNVNSPMIRDWIGKEVQFDDLTKHDKWLCMMTPRLKLLRDLLHDDGAIFITIDDNEYAHLKALMDEIFGEQNFVANICWQARKSIQNDTDISVNHNYVLVYAKNRRLTDRRLKENNANRWFNLSGFVLNPLLLDKTKFSNPDDDERGPWKADPFDAPNVRENLTYPITNPNTGKEYWPPKGRCWRTEKKNYDKLFAEKRILFGTKGTSGPQLKVFWEDKKEFGEIETSWWGDGSMDSFLSDGVDWETASEWTNYGTTTNGSRLLQKIFDDEKVFNNPKPIELIKHIVLLATRKEDIILDSFAGSGTTMHAVFDLNKTDGGNRRCVLIQMTESSDKAPEKNICKDVTRERIKRAIKLFQYDAGFKYYRVGSPIDPETLLAGNLPTYTQFAEYVYYLATGAHHPDLRMIDPSNHFVGAHGNHSIYLIYEQDMDKLTRLALTLQIAEEIERHSDSKRRIVFAPSCFLDEEYMTAKQIDFVSVPYNLFERKPKG